MPILTDEERLGTKLADKYELETILGRGGMGVVFGGLHTWTGRPVAVKLMRPELLQRRDSVRRFMREARTAASIQHPNVVQVLDMGEDGDGTIFIVLELLRGESLVTYLERHGPFDVRNTLEILLPVMRALSVAHVQGVVHRDLKPDNIFLCRDPKGRVVPKLLDFGIAKMAKAEGSKATMQTAAGSIIGTPEYMSPEQARGVSNLGPSSDVWSMAVIFFEALTGELPFISENSVGMLAKLLTETPRPISPDRGGRALSGVINRAMTVDAAMRYSDMSAFHDAVVGAAGRDGEKLPLSDRAWSIIDAPLDDDALESNGALMSTVGEPSDDTGETAFDEAFMVEGLELADTRQVPLPDARALSAAKRLKTLAFLAASIAALLTGVGITTVLRSDQKVDKAFVSGVESPPAVPEEVQEEAVEVAKAALDASAGQAPPTPVKGQESADEPEEASGEEITTNEAESRRLRQRAIRRRRMIKTRARNKAQSETDSAPVVEKAPPPEKTRTRTGGGPPLVDKFR